MSYCLDEKANKQCFLDTTTLQWSVRNMMVSEYKDIKRDFALGHKAAILL